MARQDGVLPRTVGDTVSAHGHIAAMQADVILRELSEARDDHRLRALVLRACAALYDAAAAAERAEADTVCRLAEVERKYNPDPDEAAYRRTDQ